VRHAGVADEDLGRLHSPIGLDLGAGTPAEVAVSITAELVAARSKAGLGRAGMSLKDASGPIHHYAPIHHAAIPCDITAGMPERQEVPWT
jgi:xanthine dehydrogenase accessory factor